MLAASWAGASAACRRPGLAQLVAEVVQRAGEVGEVGVGVGLGELPADGDGFLGGGQGGLPPPGLASRLPRLFSAMARSGR